MQFDVIYSDPAWEFQNKKTGGTFESGASQKYSVMPLSAIQQLPVQSISNPNAALFLWVPTRLKFSHGYTTAMAWGFHSYETTVYWNKCRKGMGYWLRNQVEELLIFTRGDVEPFRCQLPNIISVAPGEHSEKPEEFRRLIETATGKFSKRTCVELFARKKVTGWLGLGNVTTGNDIKADIRAVSQLSEDAVLALRGV